LSAKKTKPKPQLAGVLDAAVDVSRRQAKIIEEMRDALERGDEEEALKKAHELTGVPTNRKRNGGLSK
jgi:hypothetical protein